MECFYVLIVKFMEERHWKGNGYIIVCPYSSSSISSEILSTHTWNCPQILPLIYFLIISDLSYYKNVLKTWKFYYVYSLPLSRGFADYARGYQAVALVCAWLNWGEWGASGPASITDRQSGLDSHSAIHWKENQKKIAGHFRSNSF